MTESHVEIARIPLSRRDDIDASPFAAGQTVELALDLPSHGSSSHAWDLFHDLACAVWLARALEPHARLLDAQISEGHFAVTLSLFVRVTDAPGLRATLTQAHPLWSEDDALDAEREAVDGEVLDYAEEVEPGDLRELPAWLSAHYFRWRDAAREIAARGD
jgi:hypothetical protein